MATIKVRREVIIISKGIFTVGLLTLLIVGALVRLSNADSFIKLKVPYVNKEIDLSKGIEESFWNSLTAGIDVSLSYQVLVLPWPQKENIIKNVFVKAFHNRKDIYFYLSWADETEDRELDIHKFPDACAIMFILPDTVTPADIMMGIVGTANIWQWRANRDREYWFAEGDRVGKTAYTDYYYPFEKDETLPVSKKELKSAVEDLIAKGPGTITPKEIQNVFGRGYYDKAKRRWHVVFKRSLKAQDEKVDVSFEKRRFAAFAIWNGANGDRGGRKAISNWVELEIEP
jgi:hypothetical protein